MRNRTMTFGTVTIALAVIGFTGGTKLRSQITDRKSLERFATLPGVMPSHGQTPSDELVSLGRMLYFDPRLSRDQNISCNSCHPLARYGADGEPTSAGFKGQRGNRNSPSVYNAAAQRAQFWDGRAASVEDQAKGPMLNPVEMAMPSAKAVVQVLESMPEYTAAFRKTFPGDKNPVTFDHAAEAIGAFERGLVTPARWDRYLQGDDGALSAEEKRGFHVFLDAGCAGCHNGALLGGMSFQKLGNARPYPDTADPGRYNVTKEDADRMYFKVAPLRNVAVTRPYFHNGKVATLQEAVSQMAEYQLGRQLTAGEVESVVKWLGTLTGDLPAEYIKEPPLPKSTPRTPKPAPEG